MRLTRTVFLLVTSLMLPALGTQAVEAAAPPAVKRQLAAHPVGLPADRFFTTSDGVRLHYLDTSGARNLASPILVFVPGWTMPGWIFDPQIRDFSGRYRVIVLDPRGQGSSDVPQDGYTYSRRGQDIAELMERLAPQRVVLFGWSLGVLDALAYVHRHGDAALAGLVLIDNSVGEDPPPQSSGRSSHPAPRQTHAAFMASFVRGMFRRPQPPAYLRQLTEASLRTPEYAANALLSYAVPRTYWKEAIYSTKKPILYVVRPGLAGQAANLAANHPAAESVVLPEVGHALFVDEATRFDAIVQSFLTRRFG